MVSVKLIPVTKSILNDVEIIQGQLAYCVDTMENYYDIAINTRIQLSTTVQISTENSRKSMVNPSADKMYIVVETNKLYIYSGTQWVIVNTEDQCNKFLFNADVLKPSTLTQNGINQAPKTLASQVYFPDGSTAEEVVKQFAYEGKKVSLVCKTEHVIIQYDHQRIVDIPYPISTYDIYKYPVVVIWGDTYMPPSTYALGSEQLIFNDPNISTKKGDLITFIFNYAEVVANEGVNADTINNIRWFVGKVAPIDLRATDMWFDTAREEIKQYDGTKWNVIFKNNSTVVKRIKNVVQFSEPTDKVLIGISTFDKFRDTLLVFENGVLLDEGVDFDISEDSMNILCKNGIWDTDHGNEYFYFFVLKNVPAYSVSPDDEESNPVDTAEDARLTALENEIDAIKKQLQVQI